jgi:hypothetical protein
MKAMPLYVGVWQALTPPLPAQNGVNGGDAKSRPSAYRTLGTALAGVSARVASAHIFRGGGPARPRPARLCTSAERS